MNLHDKQDQRIKQSPTTIAQIQSSASKFQGQNTGVSYDKRRYSTMAAEDETPRKVIHTTESAAQSEEVPAISGGLISRLVRKVTPMRKAREKRESSSIAVATTQATINKIVIDDLSPRGR